MNNKIKYIGLSIIIILFGIFSLPKIYERILNSDIKDSNRLNTNERLSYLTISKEKRKMWSRKRGNTKNFPIFEMLKGESLITLAQP